MLRYYPSFRIITNLNTKGNEFTLDGKPYSGPYYETCDKKAFTGSDPETGPSKPLKKIITYQSVPGLNKLNIPEKQKNEIASKTEIKPNRIPGKPNSFYPNPTEEDYRRGYVIRYFTKKENQKGFIIEISRDEYNSIVNGTADYDITIYQTIQILWKITGPLRSTRISQYNVIAGIIDTNQRLVESSNKTFLGIKEFIGGEYTKFAKPTM